ncbi:toll/interleukin-1 receptor domain-containing protein [Stratiformator vulcanicus]|uniref:toll/interleukin-1 receptor domain-containing protein n=1 Tax=Stratiformator vulcanicus TaxID=2527980 RepID=UPI0028780A2B|nr:toll/interleukin-1 receptor domain-containing protein [Stratiformator vulcanicus]
MPSELWKNWVEPFDLFISYARKDNSGEVERLVDEIVAEIERDHESFSPGVTLRVFFDKTSIVTAQLWREKLRDGLRQSKLMVAILSPNYFASEHCRWEWEEYLRVEQARTYPGEALTPIFTIPARDLDARGALLPPDRPWLEQVRERLRQLPPEEGTPKARKPSLPRYGRTLTANASL